MPTTGHPRPAAPVVWPAASTAPARLRPRKRLPTVLATTASRRFLDHLRRLLAGR